MNDLSELLPLYSPAMLMGIIENALWVNEAPGSGRKPWGIGIRVRGNVGADIGLAPWLYLSAGPTAEIKIGQIGWPLGASSVFGSETIGVTSSGSAGLGFVLGEHVKLDLALNTANFNQAAPIETIAIKASLLAHLQAYGCGEHWRSMLTNLPP